MENSIKTAAQKPADTNILGYEKIGKLLRIYAIPSIVSMLVNALYNIVDQIFIGQGIGYLGTGATNIIFPLTIAFASFSLMLGDGASAYLSLKLGRGQKEEAARGAGNGILLSVIISISFAAAVLVFFPQFLNLFGCTAELEPYAKDYGYIVAVGFPFFAVCATINSIIRADGSPRFAMASMLIGSVLNMILDPILMFALGLGIKGAALATVISQITSFTLNVLRLRKLKSIKLKGNLKLNFSIIVKIVTLGASSFITQVFATIVMGIQNNLLKTYGAMSVYGSEIPISVIGVIFKAVEILNSIVLGLAVGSQPIIGYNYGAGNYSRVKKTLRTVILYGLIVSTVVFTLFQTIPHKIILLFGGGGNELYIEFAKTAFRLYTMFIIGSSVLVPVVTFLQAIGKGGKSAALSMMRQAIVPILGMFILGHLFGIFGVVSARAAADGLAFLLSIVLLVGELRSIGRIPQEQLDD
nr:MATE family efflux transporter [uncultured Schaedlerella sp.]